MRADVKMMGDVVVISIEGTLPIEETQTFREACRRKVFGEKVVFNMSRAHFVGSTGLQPFLETIRGIDEAAPTGLKFVGLKPEFRRLFSSLENVRFQYFEDVGTAVNAFSHAAPLSAVVTLDFQSDDEDPAVDDSVPN